jgi:hypothetical protein
MLYEILGQEDIEIVVSDEALQAEQANPCQKHLPLALKMNYRSLGIRMMSSLI